MLDCLLRSDNNNNNNNGGEKTFHRSFWRVNACNSRWFICTLSENENKAIEIIEYVFILVFGDVCTKQMHTHKPTSQLQSPLQSQLQTSGTNLNYNGCSVGAALFSHRTTSLTLRPVERAILWRDIHQVLSRPHSVKTKSVTYTQFLSAWCTKVVTAQIHSTVVCLFVSFAHLSFLCTVNCCMAKYRQTKRMII